MTRQDTGTSGLRYIKKYFLWIWYNLWDPEDETSTYRMYLIRIVPASDQCYNLDKVFGSGISLRVFDVCIIIC